MAMSEASAAISFLVRKRQMSLFAFIRQAWMWATDGGPGFYVWMTILSAVALVGVHAWTNQVVNGMAVTAMSDHVSWGLYISHFTFFVGVAAAAVMMVIPAYLYHDHEMHDAVIVGELLAIAAIMVCLLSVVVDLGVPIVFGTSSLALVVLTGRFPCSPGMSSC